MLGRVPSVNKESRAVDKKIFLNLPLYQELAQRIDSQGIVLDKIFVLGGLEFRISQDLQNKLKHNQITESASAAKLEKLLKTPSDDLGHPEDFWTLNEAEYLLLRYYVDAVYSAETLSQLNKTYDDIFSEHILRNKFRLPDNVDILCYFAKESNDPLPDDYLFIKVHPLQEEDLQHIANAINSRIDYQCNCIVHQGSLELYGVMAHIVKRLKNLKPTDFKGE